MKPLPLLMLPIVLLSRGAIETEAEKTPGELLAQIDLEAEAQPYDERLDTLMGKCKSQSRMEIADSVATHLDRVFPLRGIRPAQSQRSESA